MYLPKSPPHPSSHPTLPYPTPNPSSVLTTPVQYAQELLTTFPQDLAEVALRPATGGAFTVALSSPAASGPGSDPGAAGDIEHAHIAKTPSPNDAKATRAAESDGGIMPSRSPPSAVAGSTAERRDEVVLWERKTDGGFPGELWVLVFLGVVGGAYAGWRCRDQGVEAEGEGLGGSGEGVGTCGSRLGRSEIKGRWNPCV